METPVSRKLIELRKSHNFTQKTLANFLGITPRQYAYLEHGHFTLDLDTLYKIGSLYNISMDELFGIKKQYVYPNLDASIKIVEVE